MNRQQRRRTKTIKRNRRVALQQPKKQKESAVKKKTIMEVDMVLRKDFDVHTAIDKFMKDTEKLESGSINLKNSDYAGFDLHDRDFAGYNFANCDLVATDFRNAILCGTHFDGCNKDEAIFDKEYLTNEYLIPPFTTFY